MTKVDGSNPFLALHNLAERPFDPGLTQRTPKDGFGNATQSTSASEG